ncbi:MAG TPA: TetR-like C-terminal domain-containing protein, partial [Acidimicrobiales bacterium]
MAGQRERARRAVLDDITAEGRRQLARDGAAALSLRSVARALDMVSSGIYRYVESRDALLTLLIIAGYDRLGAALEQSGAAEETPRERWQVTCGALRAWATANPHEYALLYGSPVHGYAAPQDTIGPATRVYVALAAPLRDAPAPTDRPAVSGTLATDGERIADGLGLALPPAQGVALLGAWATLFGLVSLELF